MYKFFLGLWLFWGFIIFCYTPCKESREYKQSGSESQLIELQIDFRQLNNNYFHGKLPQTTILFQPELKELLGYTDCDVTRDGVGPCRIHINSLYGQSDRISGMVLRHETCHVATYREGDRHEEKWHACMVGLADRGAWDDVW